MIRIFNILATILTVLFTAVTIAGFVLQSEPSPDATDLKKGTYMIDKDHTQVQFKVKHLGISTVTGNFADFDIALEVPQDGLSSLNGRATIKTGSIDTGIQKRDDHLRSADFFDVANHPEMTFVGHGARNVRDNSFELPGDLTIRGVTNPVVMEVEYVGSAPDPMGNEKVAFTAHTRINRKDYGLNWNNVIETGGLVVADEVDILLEVQAMRQK